MRAGYFTLAREKPDARRSENERNVYMKRRAQVWTLGAAILAVCITFGGSLFAAEGGHRFQVGVRPGIIGSDGEPSNDMPMGGVYGRYRLDTG